MPSFICNNCIYRLGAAYHFKQQCENSDLRLRSYLGMIDKGYSTRDNETSTDDLDLLYKRKMDDDHDKSDEEKLKVSKRFPFREEFIPWSALTKIFFRNFQQKSKSLHKKIAGGTKKTWPETPDKSPADLLRMQ